MNKLFKACYNNLRTEKSLSGLCELIVCTFLPDMLQKYLVANAKISSDFKLYDPSIPQYLHNRPHFFVKHCMQRLSAANLNFSPGDVTLLTTTSFLVKSADSPKSYEVQLGDSNNFPRCECPDFERHYLPCKHFFAVFAFVPGYSWDSLPHYFTESPFITIDRALPNDKHITEEVISTNTHSRITKDEIGDPTAAISTSPNAKALSQTLRCNLQQLIDFSYECKNHSTLSDVNQKVVKILHHCRSKIPLESGLALRSPVKQKKPSTRHSCFIA